MKLDRGELISELKKIVDSALRAKEVEGALGDDDYIGTFHIPLDNYNGNDWAIVVAWMDYDNDRNWKLYGKVAYQSDNSIMQCDYDIDWIMPYNEETGEVDDTEVLMQSEYNIEWLVDQWYRIKETYLTENEE